MTEVTERFSTAASKEELEKDALCSQLVRDQFFIAEKVVGMCADILHLRLLHAAMLTGVKPYNVALEELVKIADVYLAQLAIDLPKTLVHLLAESTLSRRLLIKDPYTDFFTDPGMDRTSSIFDDLSGDDEDDEQEPPFEI